MDKFLATIEVIIDKYEKAKIRLPNPNIKIGFRNFAKNPKPELFLEYFKDNKQKLLNDMAAFLSMANSAVAVDKTNYVPVSSFYRLASELASDISTNNSYELSKMTKLQQYTEYPDLKLPIGYQLNLWRTILSVLPESDEDYKSIQGKIIVLETELSQQSPGAPNSEQLGQIVSGVAEAFKKPNFQGLVQNIMSDVQTGDASQIFGKIFSALQNPEFRDVIEDVVKPVREQQPK